MTVGQLVTQQVQSQGHNPLITAYNTLILDIVTPTCIASITTQRVKVVNRSSTPVVEATIITTTRWPSVVKPASPSTDPQQGYNMQSTTSGPTMALDTTKFQILFRPFGKVVRGASIATLSTVLLNTDSELEM
ncbi:hypothetical protein Pcinc_030335 [Petrolisthes cinctipes]|uniref:Uncharacterized protein n=1 Tax=Petrolisthes cinctipes TaxID=88211 RepID=A0AAE1K4M1_PETCI|nr:hypothetical protein Pcinc_030335 [Petrolisthes cinctipes]